MVGKKIMEKPFYVKYMRSQGMKGIKEYKNEVGKLKSQIVTSIYTYYNSILG